jgi:putative tricarboxylic transport membrane protein
MIRIVADLALSLGFFAGSIYLWFAADTFQKFPRYQNIDSDFWPKILLVMIAILALAQAWQQLSTLMALRAARRRAGHVPEVIPASELNWRKLLAAAALVVLYFVGLQTVGFLLSTVVFLFLGIRLVGYERKVTGVIYPLVFTAVVTLIFVKVLSMPLPRGMGPFETFSRLFY